MSGSSSSSQGGTQAVNNKREVSIPSLSADGAALREKLSGLSGDQIRALQGALQLMRSGQTGDLLPHDQAQVANAYSQARDTYNQDMSGAVKFLGGGRAEHLSPQPISAQALSRVGLGLGDINSAEAASRLRYGLLTNDARNRAITSLGQALPGASVALSTRELAERMAVPTIHESGTGSMSGSGAWTPANLGLDTGMRLAGAVGGMALAGQNAWNAWNAPSKTSSPNTNWTGDIASPLR